MNDNKLTPAQKIKKLLEETRATSAKIENTGNIYIKKALKFEEKTALNKTDIKIMFLGIALHAARIYIINKMLERTKANENEGVEGKVKEKQQEISKKHKSMDSELPREYYAPLKQIYTGRGVPYDATRFDQEVYFLKAERPDIFKRANHRFSTFGHDPLLGMIFGTVNILTNTITATDKGPEGRTLFIHKIETYHVKYDEFYGYPIIAGDASLAIAFSKVYERYKNDENGGEAIKAAVVKQILHLASDMYTVAGIQLPFIMEFVDKKLVESITKNISTGDVLKQGLLGLFAWLIDVALSALHGFLYNKEKDGEKELYDIKTRTVVDSSNLIASTSSVVASLLEAYTTENIDAAKNADFGGMLVAIKRILESEELRKKIREEYIVKGVVSEVLGDEWVIQTK